MSPANVLIVTNRRDIRELFQSSTRNSSQLHFASHRSEVIPYLKKNRVAGVIADHRVGLTSGVEILKEIWGEFQNPDLVLLREDQDTDTQTEKWIRRYTLVLQLPVTRRLAERLTRALLESFQESDEDEGEEADRERMSERGQDKIYQEITAFIDTLPPLPFVVRKIIEIIDREDVIAKDIAEIISLDYSLTARILRLVNSALYALASPVTSIQHAVTLLGFTEVRNLALGLKFVEAFPPDEQIGLDRHRFWEHSIATALSARHMTTFTGGVSPEEAFLGGLLHDIGKIILDSYFKGEWREVEKRCRAEKISPLAAEAKIFGVSHMEVGSWLAEHWKLPPIYQLAIRRHHDQIGETELPPEDAFYCSIVRTSNVLVKWLGLGVSGSLGLRYLSTEEWGQTSLDDRQLVEVFMKTVKELKEWKKNLGLALDEEDYFESTRTALLPRQEDIPQSLLCIGSPKERAPSLRSMLMCLGFDVQSVTWKDQPLAKVEEVPHRLLVLDIRQIQIETKRLSGVLKAARSRSKAPIVIFAGNGPNIPQSLEKHRIFSYQKAPNWSALSKVLKRALSG